MSLARSWWKVLLLLVPAAAYFAWPFWGGHADFMKETKKERWILAGTFITGHVIALLALYIPGSGLNSPFRLYNDKPVLQMCVKNLGVLTTMRRDLQRQLFNFTSSGLELSESRPEESSVPVTPAEDSSVSASSVPEESHPIQEENSVVTVPEYNTLEIDFDQLIQEAPSDTVAAMHKYFQSVEPTLKNEYTGMFEGYNLILITAESFSSWVIDQELTPMLYKMANSCFVFENFYTPYWAVSTSDGEYATHTSLIPKEDVWSYYWSGFNEMPFGLGTVIGDLTSRRGQIQGQEARPGAQQVDALVPLANMFGYATDLRSNTQGRGQYTMEPHSYAEIPKSIRDKIVEERGKKAD